jgi:hypothetical protein
MNRAVMKIRVKTGHNGASWRRSWTVSRTPAQGPIRGIAQCAQGIVGKLIISQEGPGGTNQGIIPRPLNVAHRDQMFRKLRGWISDFVLLSDIHPVELTPWPKNPQAMLGYLIDRMPEFTEEADVFRRAQAFGKVFRAALPLSSQTFPDGYISMIINGERRELAGLTDPNWAYPSVLLEPLLLGVKGALIDAEYIPPIVRQLVNVVEDATQTISEYAPEKSLAIQVNLLKSSTNPSKVTAQVSAWREFPRSKWREVEWKVELRRLPKPFQIPKERQLDLEV